MGSCKTLGAWALTPALAKKLGARVVGALAMGG